MAGMPAACPIPLPGKGSAALPGLKRSNVYIPGAKGAPGCAQTKTGRMCAACFGLGCCAMGEQLPQRCPYMAA